MKLSIRDFIKNDRKMPLPYFFLGIFSAMSLLQWLHLLAREGTDGIGVMMGLLGIAVGWAAYASAVAIIIWAVLRRIRKKEARLSQIGILPLLTAMSGGYLLYTAVYLYWILPPEPNFLDSLGMLIPGVLMTAWSMLLRRHPPKRSLVGWAASAAVIIFFALPREAGNITWNRYYDKATSTSNASNSSSCNGLNLNGRPDNMSAYRPKFTVTASTEQTTLGDLLKRRLEKQSDRGKNAAYVNVSLHNAVEGLGCYLPLVHFNEIDASVDIQISYTAGEGSLEKGDGWKINCNGSSHITYHSTRLLFGIASCRDLLKNDADALADKVMSEIKSQLGHQ